MESWEIYWFTRLDSIRTFFLIFTLLTTLSGFVWFLFCSIELYDFEKAIKTTKNVTIPILIISSLIVVFTPSSKDMAMKWHKQVHAVIKRTIGENPHNDRQLDLKLLTLKKLKSRIKSEVKDVA